MLRLIRNCTVENMKMNKGICSLVFLMLSVSSATYGYELFTHGRLTKEAFSNNIFE
jgi:hypothetical protein